MPPSTVVPPFPPHISLGSTWLGAEAVNGTLLGSMVEAGLAATAFAAETAVEEAVAAAFAVASSTVPLYINFYKLPSPSPLLSRSSHTLTVVKGKAYSYGGDVQGQDGDSGIHAITQPSDLDLKDLDYQYITSTIAPGQLASCSDNPPPSSTGGKNGHPAPRAAHASTSIDTIIYVLGGRPPSSETASPLNENGTVLRLTPQPRAGRFWPLTPPAALRACLVLARTLAPRAHLIPSRMVTMAQSSFMVATMQVATNCAMCGLLMCCVTDLELVA